MRLRRMELLSTVFGKMELELSDLKDQLSVKSLSMFPSDSK